MLAINLQYFYIGLLIITLSLYGHGYIAYRKRDYEKAFTFISFAISVLLVRVIVQTVVAWMGVL